MKFLVIILTFLTLSTNTYSQIQIPLKKYGSDYVIDLNMKSLIQMFEMTYSTLDKELAKLKNIRFSSEQSITYHFSTGKYMLIKSDDMLNIAYELQNCQIISGLKNELYNNSTKSWKEENGSKIYYKLQKEGYYYLIGITEEVNSFNEYTCKVGIMKFRE